MGNLFSIARKILDWCFCYSQRISERQ